MSKPESLIKIWASLIKSQRLILGEFTDLSAKQKARLLLPVIAISLVGAFVIPPPGRPKLNIKSPVVPLERAEVAAMRLEPAADSPFRRLMSNKILGFKNYLAKTKNLQYEVFGYLPYWSFDKIPYLRLDLLSTIAYFGLEIDPATGDFLKNGAAWNNWDGPEMKQLINQARPAKTKIVVTIKLFDNGPIERFLTCGRCQEITIRQTVAQIKEKVAQGVNVDFEYFGSPGGETVIAFAQFMKNLTDVVHKEISGSQVSMATYATSAREERIHNVDLVGNFIDYVVIMGYDFFRPSSTHAGPVSPLSGVEKYGYDLKTSVADFVAKIPAEKVVLGVPYYGYDWPVESNTPNAKVLDFNDETGGLNVPYFYQTIDLEKTQTKLVRWDDLAEVPFYTYFDADHKVWRQMYFENERSLREKFEYVKSQKIRGVGLWALGFDGDRPELWDLLEKTFTKL